MRTEDKTTPEAQARESAQAREAAARMKRRAAITAAWQRLGFSFGEAARRAEMGMSPDGR